MSHIPRLLVDLPLAAGTRLTLPRAKAHHLNTVLRLDQGAPLRLFNGDGNEYTAAIATASRNSVDVIINTASTPQRESPLNVTLAQGIARGERMDFVIAKAVELGARTIQPLFCERGRVRLIGARLDKKQTHWQRIAESAAEQSGRLIWPRVETAVSFDQFMTASANNLRLILALGADTSISALQPATNTTLLVGPESGFSGREVEMAIQADCTPLNLGPRILRTETAGMAALAALQSHWGDLG